MDIHVQSCSLLIQNTYLLRNRRAERCMNYIISDPKHILGKEPQGWAVHELHHLPQGLQAWPHHQSPLGPLVRTMWVSNGPTISSSDEAKSTGRGRYLLLASHLMRNPCAAALTHSTTRCSWSIFSSQELGGRQWTHSYDWSPWRRNRTPQCERWNYQQ